jgi:hypothetical protein
MSLHEQHQAAAAGILRRLGAEPSMLALWQRLERAEADRDRMMNALQLALDHMERGKVTARTKNIARRALSRIQPVRTGDPA